MNSEEIERFVAGDALNRLGLQLELTCPGDIEEADRAVFSCTAESADGVEVPVEVVHRREDGSVSWQIDARTGEPIEAEIEREILAKRRLEVQVDCPDLIRFRKGSTFSCRVTDQRGRKATVKVTQTDDEGGVRWSI